MTETALEIRGLSKSFGATAVLRGIDLTVERGRLLGFVGPNGSGKSTGLRCVLGLVKPDAGAVLVDGVDAIANPVGARRRCSYLTGESSAYRWMRGREYLHFGFSFGQPVDQEILAMCRQRFELPIDRKIRSYSAGQKQMLALTLALSLATPLLILDEPEKALDASRRFDLREILGVCRERGRAIIVSSHHIAELEDLADEYAFLLDGKIIDSARIASEQERLSREVHAQLDREPNTSELPAGTSWTRSRDGVYHFVASPGAATGELGSALIALGARSLQYGEAKLQQVYESLYVEAKS